MTPINPAAAGGLPEYARQDVVSSGVGYAPVEPAYEQSIDPAQPGFVDPYATSYQTTPAIETNIADQYGSAVAGTQPQTTNGYPPQASPTVDAFADLGIFTQDELVQLSRMNLSPEEMIGLYEEAVAFMQTPEFAQWSQGHQPSVVAEHYGTQQPGIEQPGMAQPGVEAPAGSVPAGAVAPAAGEPAWNDQWADKFKDMLKEQGLNSKTRMMVIASLKASGLDEASLAQGFDYYANTPEGKAELQAANDQVKAGVDKQNLMMLTMGGGVVAVGGVAGAIGASRGNLVKALERTAAGTGDRAATAARALDDIRASRPLTNSARAEVVSALRGEAGDTSRLRNPIAKMSLNGGARNLSPAKPISFKEAMKYGLGMKFGDGAADAAAGATSASRSAASAVAGGGDDAVRAVAGGVDDVAKGVGMLGKVGKVLGPVGLALSAGVGIWGIKKTMDAEGGFGEESAKMTGNVAGGIAGGVAGAAAGAAIGSVVPVIGTGIGAIVGGVAGSIGLGKIGESVGGFLHGLFD